MAFTTGVATPRTPRSAFNGGAPLPELQRQRLNGMCFNKFVFLLPLFRLVADTGPGRHHKQGQMVAPAFFSTQNLIAQTQAVFAALAPKTALMDR